MAQETERKFLVLSDSYKEEVVTHARILQAYLSTLPERTVRIRIEDNKAFLTIKGLANDTGMSRYEWEKEIPVNEAEELRALCEPGQIEKTRYLVPAGKHHYQVDEFAGDNEGLVIAEIELNQEEESFEKPPWLGREVTNERRYYNAMLLKKPYNTW